MSFSLEVLEFDRLLRLVARYAQTPMGARLIEEARPHSEPASLTADLGSVDEAISLNDAQISWSFSGIADPEKAVAILRIQNAVMGPEMLIETARTCRQALFARSAIKPEADQAPRLWDMVEGVAPSLLDAVAQIDKKLLPGGEMDDNASPELSRIRREINSQRARLTRSLEAAMRAAGSAIQDEIVTIRNERFVIPVKSDFKGKVGGVAHGYSSSGNTIFVEPFGAIEANNEIQNLRGQEEREIARILFSLTELFRQQLTAVEAAVDAVGHLDAVRAKVEFARAYKAVVPVVNDDYALDLVNARHPLLEETLREARSFAESGGDEEMNGVVPSSFALSAARSVMVISGANAGGKTVVLKTAGLLSLMAVSGFPVPADVAKIPFYRSILADIGDHQSLSANLSTFSSHMSNIASMLDGCRPPSLVLLDEAGTGTDPEEGSALGVAIVDHFRRACHAQVIASTHYRGLKMYAAEDSGVINASVEFDERTLQPTYRLLIGLAGASSGIEIARRFGIDQPVIDLARENLDASSRDAEAYLQRLQTETRQVEDLRAALEEERDAVAIKYAGLEIEAVKKEKERRREFEGQLADAVNAFDRQSKAFMQTIEDKALKNRLEKDRQARKAELNRSIVAKVQGTRSGIGGTRINSSHVKIGSPDDKQPNDVVEVPPPGAIQIGSHVITSFGNVGTVERMDKDIAEVLVGGMRLREKISNLQPTEESPDSSPHQTKGSAGARSTLQRSIDPVDASAELNLIGKTTADAEYELDRFLDEAYMASLPRVRIIHGFGTGALKNYVHHFLKGHDLVERFVFAPPDQGGNGATIAEMKL